MSRRHLHGSGAALRAVPRLGAAAECEEVN